MAAQTKILTKVGETITPVSGKSFAGAVGTLAIGKPGDITSKAFGPVVMTGILANDTVFGAYVADKGVVCNSNDVANMMNYDENFTAKKGQTVGFLTYGTLIVPADQLDAIKAAMNVRVIYGDPSADSIVDIEVTGFKAASGSL